MKLGIARGCMLNSGSVGTWERRRGGGSGGDQREVQSKVENFQEQQAHTLLFAMLTLV
jgi:hypothetical protein